MKAHVTDSEVVGGINASADMFYGSQGATSLAPGFKSRLCSADVVVVLRDCVAGRPPKFFDDRNEGLLERIEAKHPDLAVCEMETNHLCVTPTTCGLCGQHPLM